MVRAALTFDVEHADRPATPGGTGRVLAALAEGGIRATFLLQGRWAEAEPALARSIAAAGHVIGNHGHYHGRMSFLTPAGLDDDLQRSTAAIEAASGVSPRPWFRCPFGDGARDPGVLAALASAGFRHVGWHVDGLDWAEGATPDGLRRSVLDGVAATGDGAVVLLHAWPTPTAEAVTRIIAAAPSAGIELVGIDELASVPADVPW